MAKTPQTCFQFNYRDDAKPSILIYANRNGWIVEQDPQKRRWFHLTDAVKWAAFDDEAHQGHSIPDYRWAFRSFRPMDLGYLTLVSAVIAPEPKVAKYAPTEKQIFINNQLKTSQSEMLAIEGDYFLHVNQCFHSWYLPEHLGKWRAGIWPVYHHYPTNILDTTAYYDTLREALDGARQFAQERTASHEG